MTRLRLTILAFVVAVVASWALFFSPAALITAPGLNEEGFERIKRGMSLSEVRNLLGGREGNYGSYPDNYARQTDEGFSCPPGSGFFGPPGRVWYDDNDRFEICFDRSFRVVDTHKRAYWEMKGSPIDRIRRIMKP